MGDAVRLRQPAPDVAPVGWRYNAVSPYVPDQESFVIPYGIESVLGFGGVLPSNEFFVVILFSRVRISRETVELLKPLAMSVESALLPFEGRGSKRSLI